jgi:hypothetical protein
MIRFIWGSIRVLPKCDEKCHIDLILRQTTMDI